MRDLTNIEMGTVAGGKLICELENSQNTDDNYMQCQTLPHKSTTGCGMNGQQTCHQNVEKTIGEHFIDRFLDNNQNKSIGAGTVTIDGKVINLVFSCYIVPNS